MPPFLSVTDILEIYQYVFTIDLSRYLIGAGGVFLLVNLLLPNRLWARKIQKGTYSTDQIKRELLASLRTICIFAANGTLIVIGAKFGILPLYDTIAQYGWWYLILSTLLLIVVHDVWFYWAHRLLHQRKIFRRCHLLHHKSYAPTALTAYSFDIAEAVVNAIYLPLILVILPAHPLALFIFTAHMMLRNAIGHSGYELFPANPNGRPLLGWLTTVTHHDLHHSNAGYNFGLYFTWWDRWMGTEHPAYHQEFARVAYRMNLRPAAIGLVLLLTVTILGLNHEVIGDEIRKILICSGTPWQSAGVR